MQKRTFNLKDVTTPKEGLVVYKDAYWLCVDGNPEQALFFGDSPQCNKDKRICEWGMKEGRYGGYDNLQITFVEFAFVPPQN